MLIRSSKEYRISDHGQQYNTSFPRFKRTHVLPSQGTRNLGSKIIVVAMLSFLSSGVFLLKDSFLVKSVGSFRFLNAMKGSSFDIHQLDSFKSNRVRGRTPYSTGPSRRARTLSSQKGSDVSAVSSNEWMRRDFSNYLGDKHPLQVIFVGHNPSEVSWEQIAPYAHSTNKFWRLLKEAKLAPEKLCQPRYFARLPAAAGIGFIDLFVTSGSDASKVGRRAEKESEWREDFLRRLDKGTQGKPPRILCCVSKIVAKKLLKGWNGDYGKVGKGLDWKLTSAMNSDVWVLPSTSGRAGLTWIQRLKPFQRLGEELSKELSD